MTAITTVRPRRAWTLDLEAVHERFPGVPADRAELETRVTLASIGFVPVTLIAITTFGMWGLRQLALAVLMPAVLVLGALVHRTTVARSIVARAVVRGVVATFGYDLFRWSFLWLGLMQTDPIPHIGTALGLSPAWVFGYLWRYLGNGGGLAIAFTAFGLRGVRAGMLFGAFVCAGLLATLAIAPLGQELLFPLSPTTVVMATVGHLIYGAILGATSARR